MAAKNVCKSVASDVADVMGQLSALLPNAKPKAAKASKWELPLTEEAKADAVRWINAKTVLEPIAKRMENAKNDFNEYALRYMAEKLFTNKNKPSNPLVIIHKSDKKTVDHQFQFMMNDKFKYRFPDIPEGVSARLHLIEFFTDLGLEEDDATRLVDNELDFNPIIGLRSLTELMEGHYGEEREWIDSSEEEKAAGNKLAMLLMWNGDLNNTPEPLTSEEKATVIDRSTGIQVKAGFYDRVATYTKTVDQLMAVFKVIQPIVYPAYPKFAVSDTETDKTARKIEAAADILGTLAVSEED
jgi:hypothetical protein